MQYIFTEEELNNLKDLHDREIKDLKNNLQLVCTILAENQEMKWGRHGCIKSVINPAKYCCGCIVLKICPQENKRYSK